MPRRNAKGWRMDQVFGGSIKKVSCDSIFWFDLHRGIEKNIPMTVLNGDPDRRYPGNINYSFAYVEGESLLMV
jgi:hypothetical protein